MRLCKGTDCHVTIATMSLPIVSRKAGEGRPFCFYSGWELELAAPFVRCRPLFFVPFEALQRLGVWGTSGEDRACRVLPLAFFLGCFYR